jgi:hypothetical protein
LEDSAYWRLSAQWRSWWRGYLPFGARKSSEQNGVAWRLEWRRKFVERNNGFAVVVVVAFVWSLICGAFNVHGKV